MFQLSQKKQMDIGFDYRHLPKAARISARLSKPNQGAFRHQEVNCLSAVPSAGGDERERDEHEREREHMRVCVE
jgi:hypothetical protein